MESQALVTTQQPNSLTMVGAGLNTGTFVLRPTWMKLVQPTTDTKGVEVTPGTFFHPKTGSTFKPLEMVIADILMPRSKYPSAKFVRGEKPICRSNGVLTPQNKLLPVLNDDRLQAQAPQCGYYNDRGRFIATCEHASWANYNNKTKTGPKPTCKDSRLIVFAESTSGLPMKMLVQGKAIKVVDALREGIIQTAMMLKAKGVAKLVSQGMSRQDAMGKARTFNIYDFNVTLTSQKADGPYFDLVVAKVDPMTEADAAMFRSVYESLAAQAANYEEEDEEAIDATEAVETVGAAVGAEVI